MSSPAAPGIWVSLHFRAQLRRIFNIILLIAKFVALPLLYVIGVLAFVDAFTTGEKRCFAKGLVLPNWIACAIANHESLTTGLIGSAAGLCAVFIALRKFRLAEERREQSERRREKLEQDAIRRVVGYYSRLLEPFDEPSGTDDINYVDRLNSFFATGKFWHISFASVPVEYRPDARHVWGRLKALNRAQNLKALNRAQKKSGTDGGFDSKQMNENIREVVLDMRGYLDCAQKDLVDRETPVEA
jgi:hypothetical protein